MQNLDLEDGLQPAESSCSIVNVSGSVCFLAKIHLHVQIWFSLGVQVSCRRMQEEEKDQQEAVRRGSIPGQVVLIHVFSCFHPPPGGTLWSSGYARRMVQAFLQFLVREHFQVLV